MVFFLSLKIVHITTAHTRFDSRIFYKQCKSLASCGFDVSLIVADSKGDSYIEGITIKDIGTYAGRLKRMFFSPLKALYESNRLKPAIVHIHDPELLFMGLLLKLTGIIVIYDAHEDLPEQIKRKFWIPHYLRPSVSSLSKILLRMILFFYDAVVVATDSISTKIVHRKIAIVKNYPILSEFTTHELFEKEAGQFCYAGLMTEDRGLFTMINALPKENAKLALAGIFYQESLKEKFHKQQNRSHDKIQFLGYLSRKEIARLYSDSVAGLVILQAGCGYEETLPIKLFEYMAASLPVVCSNFPFWEELLDGCNCAFIVDSSKMNELNDAMQQIIRDPELAMKKGREGRRLVEDKYNWDIEAKKLIALYSGL